MTRLAGLAGRDVIASTQFRAFGVSGPLGARPTRVNLEIIDRCCLRCSMCDIWRHDGNGELVAADWIRVLDDLTSWLGTFHLTVTGGEPFMKAGIWDVLGHAARRGIPTAVITNGYCFNDTTLERLARLELVEVVFSIDGLDAGQHDAVRGVDGAYLRTSAALERLIASKRAFLVATSTVIVEETIVDLGAIATAFATKGVDRIFFQPVQGGFTDDDGSLWPYDSPLWPSSDERVNRGIDGLLHAKKAGAPVANSVGEIESFRDYFLAGKDWRRPWACPVKYTTFHCDAYGDVRMCVPYPGNVGNVTRSSPREIWQGAAAAAERDVITACTKACVLNCTRQAGIGEKVRYGATLLAKRARS
jgi:MoaA/NifB/PqqE/SkfB family radical SAM enzyme